MELPNEILEEIFSYLKPKKLAKVSSVSKQWNAVAQRRLQAARAEELARMVQGIKTELKEVMSIVAQQKEAKKLYKQFLSEAPDDEDLKDLLKDAKAQIRKQLAPYAKLLRQIQANLDRSMDQILLAIKSTDESATALLNLLTDAHSLGVKLSMKLDKACKWAEKGSKQGNLDTPL